MPSLLQRIHETARQLHVYTPHLFRYRVPMGRSLVTIITHNHTQNSNVNNQRKKHGQLKKSYSLHTAGTKLKRISKLVQHIITCINTSKRTKLYAVEHAAITFKCEYNNCPKTQRVAMRKGLAL